MLTTSELTKRGLQKAKARGIVLGGARPECRNNLSPEARQKGNVASAEARKKKAAESYTHLLPIMQDYRAQGMTLQAIAAKLNEDGYTTRRGKPWYHVQVMHLLNR